MPGPSSPTGWPALPVAPGAGPARPTRLCWLGGWAEADGTGGDAVRAEELVSCAEAYLAAEAGAGVLDRIYVELARAEADRLTGTYDPESWERAAASLTESGADYLALYPQWRATQAYLARHDRAAAGAATVRPGASARPDPA